MKVGDSVQFGIILSILELPTKTVYHVEHEDGHTCWYDIGAMAWKMEGKKIKEKKKSEDDDDEA